MCTSWWKEDDPILQWDSVRSDVCHKGRGHTWLTIVASKALGHVLMCVTPQIQAINGARGTWNMPILMLSLGCVVSLLTHKDNLLPSLPELQGALGMDVLSAASCWSCTGVYRQAESNLPNCCAYSLMTCVIESKLPRKKKNRKRKKEKGSELTASCLQEGV